MRPDNLIPLVLALLKREGGEVFIHDYDLMEISPGSEVVIFRLDGQNGTMLRISDPNAALDAGQAKIVEPLALPAPR